MNEKRRGRGRPRKPDARRKSIVIRLSDEEMAMLNYISEATNKSKADALRDAVNNRIQELKEQYGLED